MSSSLIAPSTASAVVNKSQENDLVGVVAPLTGLERLSLRGCRVADDDLEALERLHVLRDLTLQGLSITSAALLHLQRLTALERLNLHGLSVGPSGSVSPLSSLSSLTILSLRWCAS